MYVYKAMIEEVLKYGTRKENRTGVDTLSTFNFNYELCWDRALYGTRKALGYQYVIDEPEGSGYALPLLTTKDVSWKNIVAEMLWFLSGEPNIRILQEHGCKFWDAWADSQGNVPSAYGNFWRRFPVHGTRDSSDIQVDGDDVCSFNDQIAWALKELRKNPMSRRVHVSAWAPGNAQTSKLPPCHMAFTFNVQNVEESVEAHLARAVEEMGPSAGLPQPFMSLDPKKTGEEARSELRQSLIKHGIPPKMEQRLCLHLCQRSCDAALGIPYNMASYGLLLLIFSHLTGIKPGIFAHSLIDLHIYTSKPDGSMSEYDHVPGLKEQLDRPPRELPRLTIDQSIQELSDIETLMKPGVSTSTILERFQLSGYNPHPAIKFKVAV